ncbi:MAG: c-type cytochrome biogenesis protein CcmI [Rhodospirillales bacterium]|jgi:cytochrome c-type biogenesis protein CcmH|nr:c-type cytochrome biogenesis protein CcmI [Rhodospirillales bacterium]MBT4041791.1 c-type cytochrome biogenesis protein CcmI [Rhodospirillales bacterium]MBT4628479.1 c-type cytochrome biogenesis protein CcmI [Rhodospirillales bacterium]MBT5351083.1 c-type cytochrome biogenesis protein CcmI [Rhodospirillales bacterium]MBT5520729.1 c-type cytochrome biogenesis protein CcmI [Rhodospirillales bacterium]
MTLWILVGGMICIVVGALVLPSLMPRTRVSAVRDEFDLAVYKDQLNEVDRDVERGHVSADEADTVRLEIQRRILAVADDIDAESVRAATRSPLLVVMSLMIPVLSILFYMQLGSPHAPDFPYAARGDLSAVTQGPSAVDVENMLAGLEERLAENPDDPEGWAMLGRSYQVLERFDQSATAFQRLYELTGDIRAQSEYAEALILANDSVVNDEIIGILEQILREAPLDPKARFYFGIGVAQQGDLAEAVQIWTDLIHLSPGDASWLPTVQRQIDDAAKTAGVDLSLVTPSPEAQQLATAAGIEQTAPSGPSAEDMENAASMSADEQMEMIRSMVQRLADRLAENPEDPEGWMRLIQAYEVLGETDLAEQTRAAAAPYLP